MIATATTNFILADFITTESTLNVQSSTAQGFRLSPTAQRGLPSIRSTNPRISPVSFPDQCTDQNRSVRNWKNVSFEGSTFNEFRIGFDLAPGKAQTDASNGTSKTAPSRTPLGGRI